jgi:hypothetical protein
MKYHIEIGHIDRVKDHGWILFEQVFSPSQMQDVREASLSSAAERAGGSGSTLELQTASPVELYRVGRDHWRVSDVLRRFVLRPQVNAIGSELFEQRPLRLAYTQLLGGRKDAVLGQEPPRTSPFDGPHSLKEFSPVQGLVGAAIVCLEAPLFAPEVPVAPKREEEDERREYRQVPEPQPEQDQEPEYEAFWPSEVGDVVYVHAEHPLHLGTLNAMQGGRFLLIAYSHGSAVYAYNAVDPLTHALQKYDYAYGDRLSDARNPIVAR